MSKGHRRESLGDSAAVAAGDARRPQLRTGLQLHFVDEVDEILLAVDVQLAVDVADVGLRRAFGDVELLLDVGGLVAAGQVVHDLAFAARQQVGVGDDLAALAEAAPGGGRVVGGRGGVSSAGAGAAVSSAKMEREKSMA